MSEMTLEHTGGKCARGLLWVLAGALGALIVTYVVIMFVGGAAIAVVALAGMERGPGTLLYAVALAFMIAVYWALVHVSLRALSVRARLPWQLWLGLAIPPVVWFLTSLSDPAFAPTPTIVGLLGLVGAWFTLGKNWGSQA